MKPTGARPPGKTGVSSWTHVDAQKGEKWTGWIAGPHCGVQGHYCSRTIPCLKRYLGKNADCIGCSTPLPVEFVYYVPLYRCSDSRPVVIIVHDDQADTLSLVKKHEQVQIGRTESKYEGLYVQRLFKQLEFQTTADWKRADAKIHEFLPTLWKMRGVISPELILRGPLPDPSDTGVSLGDEPPTGGVGIDPKIRKLAEAERKEKAAQKEAERKAGKLVFRLASQIGAPEENGNGNGKH